MKLDKKAGNTCLEEEAKVGVEKVGREGGKLCSALGGKKGWSFHLGTRMWRERPGAGLCSCPSQGLCLHSCHPREW